MARSCREAEMGRQAGNSKPEARNSKQIRMIGKEEKPTRTPPREAIVFPTFRSFEFVSCFELRVSSFPQRSPSPAPLLERIPPSKPLPVRLENSPKKSLINPPPAPSFRASL